MKKVKKQLAHLFDATQCINCGACTTACAQTNYPDLINEFIPAWNTVCNNIRQVKVEKNRPMQLLVQCQQCSEAPCVTTCPFGANYYDENGLVRNDPKRCIGCNYCVASCPYDARWSNPKTGLPSKCMGEGCLELIKAGSLPACVTACPYRVPHLDAVTGKACKCDLCHDRRKAGLEPVCVAGCLARALHVSNDEDMHRKMSRQTIRWIKELAVSPQE